MTSTSKWDVVKMSAILEHAYAAPTRKFLQTSEWDVVKMNGTLEHACAAPSAK